MVASNSFGEHKLFIDQQFNPDEDFDQVESTFSSNTDFEKSSNISTFHQNTSDLPTLSISGSKTSDSNSVWLNAFQPKSAAFSTDDISELIKDDQDKLDYDYVQSTSNSPPPQPKAPVVLPTLPKLEGVKKILSPATKSTPTKLFNKVQERFTISPASQITLTKSEYSKIVIDIKNKLNVSIESTVSERNGRTIIISGSPENVKIAKSTISQRLTKPVILEFEIPSTAKALVIGSGGSTIKEIIRTYKVQIDVANEDIEGSYDEDFNEFKTLVTLKGPSDSCSSAKEAILNIVNEQGKNMTISFDIENYETFKLSDLNTTSEELLKILNVDGLTKAKVLNDSQVIAFTGSRSAIKKAKSVFKEKLTSLAAEIFEKEVSVKKPLHSLIEASIDFDKEFHVSYSPAEDSIIVKGSKQNVAKAVDYIENFANSCEVHSIIISRAHNNNLEHSRNILFYLHKNLPAINKEFHQLINKNVSLDLMPLDKVESFNFVGVKLVYKKSSDGESEQDAQENIKLAKKHLIRKIDDLKPTKTLVINDIEMNFFSKAVTEILQKENSQVSFVIKSEQCPSVFGQNNDIVLVYSDKDDDDFDFAPTDDEFKAALDSVNKSLDVLREQQKAIASEEITFAADLQDKLFGDEAKTKNLVMEQVHNKGEIIFKLHSPSFEKMTIKGSNDTVKEVLNIINNEFSEDKLLFNHTESFKIATKTVSRIIGSKGNNLNQIRNKFETEIDIKKSETDETECIIKGLHYNAIRAKVHIKNEAKKYADIKSTKVELPFAIRGSVIGAKGSNLNKLIEKYQVSIDIEDSDKNCTISGNSKNVDKCAVELSKFIDFIKENSYTEVVNVLAKNVPRIIGKQGKTIETLKQKYNVEIQLDDVPEESAKDDKAKVGIEVVGINSDVKEAVKALKEFSAYLDNFETRYLDIEPKYFKFIVGPNGSTLEEIYKKCGVTNEGTFGMNFIQPVKIPNASNGKPDDSDDDVTSKAVTLKGDKKLLNKLEQEINNIVSSVKNRVTKKYPEIPLDIYGVLIGVGGSTKKTLEETYNVELNIPSKRIRMQKDSSNADESAVEITGLIENVEACFQDIKKNYMAEIENSVEIKVPAELHAFVSQDGAFITKLSVQKQVIVRHGNKAILANSLVRNYLNKLPIPDMSNSESNTLLVSENEHYPVVAVNSEQKSENVPWKLIYEPIDLSSLGEEFLEDEKIKKSKDEVLAEAVKEVEERIEMAKDEDMYFGFVDVKTGKRVAEVLGSNGYNINKIRYQTGCVIKLPKKSDTKKIVAVYGPKANVQKAIELIKK
ncbi:uncharacterized protein HGUI_03240 [Hanseniaspora guilliermondii]|uniref:K Homology domain-containing protein n=1 Tax=Hanseniaspora guilliermondii TaxID=56406 RepID=A0A1L0B3H7_9ASCO|nr:uncharacterized protein HGUI_03240 [Hanseniaspora guilliermondii]